MFSGLQNANIRQEWANSNNNWGKVFNNGSSKICGRQPLKNLRGYALSLQNF